MVAGLGSGRGLPSILSIWATLSSLRVKSEFTEVRVSRDTCWKQGHAVKVHLGSSAAASHVIAFIGASMIQQLPYGPSILSAVGFSAWFCISFCNLCIFSNSLKSPAFFAKHKRHRLQAPGCPWSFPLSRCSHGNLQVPSAHSAVWGQIHFMKSSTVYSRTPTFPSKII